MKVMSTMIEGTLQASGKLGLRDASGAHLLSGVLDGEESLNGRKASQLTWVAFGGSAAHIAQLRFAPRRMQPTDGL